MDLVYRPWPVAAIPSRINRVRAFFAGRGFGIYFSAPHSSYTDAFFEAASGFTTIGATILPDVEVLSSDVQFWRHFSHWLGGMGIPDLAKWVLSGCMLAGRLEFYTALVILSPSFWRK